MPLNNIHKLLIFLGIGILICLIEAKKKIPWVIAFIILLVVNYFLDFDLN